MGDTRQLLKQLIRYGEQFVMLMARRVTRMTLNKIWRHCGPLKLILRDRFNDVFIAERLLSAHEMGYTLANLPDSELRTTTSRYEGARYRPKLQRTLKNLSTASRDDFRISTTETPDPNRQSQIGDDECYVCQETPGDSVDKAVTTITDCSDKRRGRLCTKCALTWYFECIGNGKVTCGNCRAEVSIDRVAKVMERHLSMLKCL
jgi:hypothetical protein